MYFACVADNSEIICTECHNICLLSINATSPSSQPIKIEADNIYLCFRAVGQLCSKGINFEAQNMSSLRVLSMHTK